MKWLVFFFLIPISGCASTSNFQSWIGAPISNAVGQFGDQSEVLYKSDNIYYWDLIFNRHSPGTAVSIGGNQKHDILTTTIFTEPYSYKGNCAFLFVVDAQKNVTEYNFWGDDCDFAGLARNQSKHPSYKEALKINHPLLFPENLDE